MARIIEGADIYETTEAIADAINADESLSARVWEGHDTHRVYITRQLSGGRQDMGFVQVEETYDDNDEHTGVSVECALTRRRSYIVSIVDGVIA